MTDDFKKWTNLAKSWSSLGSGVPALSREDIIKSKYSSEDAKFNLKSFMEDPLAINYAMGYKDRTFSMSFDVAKQVVQNLSIVAGIIQTRTNQVGSFATPYRMSKSVGYAIKHKNPAKLTTKGEREMIQSLEKFIYNCGSSEPNKFDEHRQRDDFEAFLKKIVRDSLMYDQFAAEIVPDKAGKPYEFLAVDASTIRLASRQDVVRTWMNEEAQSGSGSLVTQVNQSGIQYPYRTMSLKSPDVKDPHFLQLVHGQIANVYSVDELMFGIRNPRTDIYIQGYGYSEVEQLVSIITSHLYAEEYNRQFFRQGSSPKGLLVFRGDSMTPDQLEGFRRQWKANLEGVSNSWKTPIMQSEQGVDWVNLTQSNKDMEYGQWMEYLIKVTCFTGDTHVTMSDGSTKEIRNVYPGELVRTLEGNYREVLNVQVSTSDELVEVESDGSLPFTCTSDHPMFACTLEDLQGGLEPYEVKAGKLTKDHYLVIPKPKPVSPQSTTIDLSEYSKTDEIFFETAEETGIITGKERMYKYHDLDTELAYLLGAVSPTARSQRIKDFVSATFLSFKVITSRVEARLNAITTYSFDKRLLRSKHRHDNNMLEIACTAFVRYYLSNWGMHPDSRVLPEEMLLAARPIKIRFLAGLLDTTAEIVTSSEDTVHIRIPLKSKSFAAQVRDLLMLVGIYSDIETGDVHNPVVLTVKGSYLHYLLDVISCDIADLLRIELLTKNATPGYTYESPQFYFTPVSRVSKLDDSDSTPVYNIEVAGSHTYCVESVAAHNCAVFLIDPAELNFDLHGGVSQTPLFESSQEWKLKASRDRGLKPLLRFIAKHINNSIISNIDDNFVFDFVGLDELTEQEKHTLRTEQVTSYMTLNEIRRAEDLPDLEHGDTPMNPTYLQAIQTQMQVKQQEESKQDASGGGATAASDKGEVPNGGENEEVPNYSDNFVKSIGSDYSDWEALAGIPDEDQ